MIAVIFEVWPKPEYKEKYLELAAQLRRSVESIEGFVSVERFQSITDENKMVSLSFFETEEALNQWRNTEAHRAAQKFGRSTYFADYRLRIARIERDYTKTDRAQVPEDSLVEFNE